MISMVLGFSFNTSVLNAESGNEETTITKVDENILYLELATNIIYSVNDLGEPILMNNDLGLIEKLPTKTVDSLGNPVNIKYFEENGRLVVVPQLVRAPRWGWWNGIKCIGGTIGLIIGGGLVGIASFC